MTLKKLLCAAMLLSAGQAFADPRAGTPDDWDLPIPEPGPFSRVLADRVESGFADEADSYVVDVQGWYGGDRTRLWWKLEGEGERGKAPEDAELQLLYGRMFAPFWDWQVGVRHDFRPQPDLSHVVLGVQGVAPYEFEIDAALFVSEKGDLTARFEAEYEILFTQRLILQPRFEVNASLSDVDDVGVRSGIDNTELGIRLRYEIRREIAPYIGVSWNRQYAGTADLSRAAGAPTSVTSLVAGLRFWF